MESMAMVFFISTTTPLFSWSWTPDSIGQYTATCIFLVAFASIFRALLALRVQFYDLLAWAKYRRVVGMESAPATDTKPTSRPWRANEAVMMATVDVVLAGLSYLLMIAVMTMNVGYFLSVLGGVFLGSMVLGNLIANSAAH
ncbi:hypothetical protein LTR40_003596 [Exophiala xenobiotica]|nr:hypothetical protein LTR40_003596 [Exophiala xenobiotica]